jgi:ribosome modulation factor
MAFAFDRKPYIAGYEAGLDNKTLDNCRFTITAKRLAWASGYQAGKAERERRQSIKIDRSPATVEKSLKWLDICKKRANLIT